MAFMFNMKDNAQQFGGRNDYHPLYANEVSTSPFDKRIDALTTILEQLAVRQRQQAMICNTCLNPGHTSNLCPTMQGFPEQPQHWYDPCPNTYDSEWRDQPNSSYMNQGGYMNQGDYWSNTYDSEWRDHPNLSYWNHEDYQALPQPEFVQQQYNEPTTTSQSGMSLEDMIKALVANTQKFQQKTKAWQSIQGIEDQASQLASSLNQPEAQNFEELPSQTMINFNENLSVNFSTDEEDIEIEPLSSKLVNKEKGIEMQDAETPEKQAKVNSYISSSNTFDVVIPPIPSRLEKLNENEETSVGENISGLIERTVPHQYKDPSMFTMPNVIGELRIEHCMLNLRASINIMPYSIYHALKWGPRVVMQLADRSGIYSEKVVEDVYVQGENLIFPTDFYIIKMEESSVEEFTPLLFERPFIKTAKTEINVDEGTLSVKFYGEIVKFDIFDALNYSNENYSICSTDAIDSTIQNKFKNNVNVEIKDRTKVKNPVIKHLNNRARKRMFLDTG